MRFEIMNNVDMEILAKAVADLSMITTNHPYNMIKDVVKIIPIHIDVEIEILNFCAQWFFENQETYGYLIAESYKAQFEYYISGRNNRTSLNNGIS
jgi:hypothetical protein